MPRTVRSNCRVHVVVGEDDEDDEEGMVGNPGFVEDEATAGNDDAGM